jgi:hypothetical protein
VQKACTNPKQLNGDGAVILTGEPEANMSLKGISKTLWVMQQLQRKLTDKLLNQKSKL